MNYFNHKNVQLAYEAVYNQVLCESMEDLGLIDGYDYLEEGIPASNTDPRVTGNPSDKLDPPASVKRTTKPLPSSGPLAIINRPQRGDNFLGPTVTAGGSRYGVPNPNLNFKRPEPYVRGESYDLYATILEYLIQEGYADTLGSAEIILENMSEDWIEDIMEAKWGKQPYPTTRVETRLASLLDKLPEMRQRFIKLRDAGRPISPQDTEDALRHFTRIRRMYASLDSATKKLPQPIPPGRAGSPYRRAQPR